MTHRFFSDCNWSCGPKVLPLCMCDPKRLVNKALKFNNNLTRFKLNKFKYIIFLKRWSCVGTKTCSLKHLMYLFNSLTVDPSYLRCFTKRFVFSKQMPLFTVLCFKTLVIWCCDMLDGHSVLTDRWRVVFFGMDCVRFHHHLFKNHFLGVTSRNKAKPK